MSLNEVLTKLAVDSYDKGVNDAKQTAMEVFATAIDAAVQAEREECAKVCETFDQREAFNDEDMAVADACATAIRARGNK